MAGAKNHDYHILPPDPWPLIGSFSALAMAAGGIMWMHGGHVGKPNGGGFLFFAGLAAVLFTMFCWWRNVIKEARAKELKSELLNSEVNFGHSFSLYFTYSSETTLSN